MQRNLILTVSFVRYVHLDYFEGLFADHN